MRELVSILKALGDDNRLRALSALRGRELCVCQIVELLGLAPSTVSKHMSVLKQARLVEARKEGRWIFYRLSGGEAGPTVAGVLQWVFDCLQEDSAAGRDRSRLESILKTDPEVLCRRQRAS